MKQEHITILKSDASALTAVGITLFLIVRDVFLILNPIYERSPLAVWLGLATIFLCVLGTFISLNALYQHWKIYGTKFLKTISLVLWVRLSPLLYIFFALLFLT